VGSAVPVQCHLHVHMRGRFTRAHVKRPAALLAALPSTAVRELTSFSFSPLSFASTERFRLQCTRAQRQVPGLAHRQHHWRAKHSLRFRYKHSIPRLGTYRALCSSGPTVGELRRIGCVSDRPNNVNGSWRFGDESITTLWGLLWGLSSNTSR
jgi:hypothetical protein